VNTDSTVPTLPPTVNDHPDVRYTDDLHGDVIERCNYVMEVVTHLLSSQNKMYTN